jgi:hypothetical protein
MKRIMERFRDKLLVIIAILGWAVFTALEAFENIPADVEQSVRMVLATTLAAGLLIWMLKEVAETALTALQHGFEQLGPELQRGFQNIADSLSDYRSPSTNSDLVDFLSIDFRLLEHSLDVQLEEGGHALYSSAHIRF